MTGKMAFAIGLFSCLIVSGPNAIVGAALMMGFGAVCFALGHCEMAPERADHRQEEDMETWHLLVMLRLKESQERVRNKRK